MDTVDLRNKTYIVTPEGLVPVDGNKDELLEYDELDSCEALVVIDEAV